MGIDRSSLITISRRRIERLAVCLALASLLCLSCIGCKPVVLEVRITEELLEPTPVILSPGAPVFEQETAQSQGYGALFIEDMTIPDDTEMLPGQPFTKTWRMRNTGWTIWRDNVRLELQCCDLMGSSGSVQVGPVSMGEEIDISIEMIAPMEPGWYIGYWQLCTEDGLFGPEIWVSIWVDGMSAKEPRGESSGPAI